MKQTILRKLMLIAVLLTGLHTFAYDFESNGLYYNIISQSKLEVEVTCETLNSGYSKSPYEGDFIVPETVNYNNRTYTITKIGERAFNKCVNLKSIVFPNSIIEINEYAFNECTSLTSITLPNTVKSIGHSAFINCSNLISVILGNSVETIDRRSFYGCSKIISIIIPKSVQTIEAEAFRGCSKLMEVFFLSALKPMISAGGAWMSVYYERSFYNCHPALEQYVPSKEVYGFGTEYISFGEKTFQYTGMSPKVEWSNNLKAYNATLNVEEATFEKNAGTHTTNLIAKYSNGVDFEVEIPYTYEITKAPMTLTVNNCEREYGDDNPEFTCEATGFVDGESLNTLSSRPIYTCEATKRSNVGSYRILAELDAPNYEITYKYGTLNVKKAAMSLSVKNTERVYGNANPQLQFTYTGLKNGETVPDWTTYPTTKTNATKTSPCGVYTVTATGGVATNYDITQYIPGELTITKRELTVKANDCSKMYGDENPDFTLSYSGFANSDTKNSLTEQPTITCEATKDSNAGTYPIVVSGGDADNYYFTYKNGTLTIKPMTIGFKNQYNTVTYNDMEKSVTENWFEFVPEIAGDYNEDDFYLTVWALDSEGTYSQHETTISGGEYAGKYVNYSGPTTVGKYIFNLKSKGTNPNVVAEPARAYLTVKQGSNNLVWKDDYTITVEVGKTVDLGISYNGDMYCTFNADYDKTKIKFVGQFANSNNPKWSVTGLQEGTTVLTFGITNRKNEWGNYNFSTPSTVSRTIKVVASSAVEDVNYSNIKVYAENGNIVIEGANDGEKVEIYSVNGQCVYNGTETTIPVATKGMYIVRINGNTFKVML